MLAEKIQGKAKGVLLEIFAESATLIMAAQNDTSDQTFELRLPAIENSLSPHRLSIIRWAIASLGVERSRLETNDGGPSSLLAQFVALRQHHSNKGTARSELYVMLLKCGCSTESLASLYDLVDGTVSLKTETCLILFLGKTLESISEAEQTTRSALCSRKGMLFERLVRHLRTSSEFSSYHINKLNTPEKLLNIMCDSKQCSDPQSICDWLSFHSSLNPYIAELDIICADNNLTKPKRKYYSTLQLNMPTLGGWLVPPWFGDGLCISYV